VTPPFATLTIEQVARYPRPGTVVPGRLGFTPDGSAVTYLFSGEGNLVRSLWRHDLATGERRVLAGPPPRQEFSREEELRRERMRLREEGVTDYQFAKDARPPVLLVPSGGELLVAQGDEPLRQLSGCAGAIDPRLSPDGTKVAFVRDGDLWVTEIAGGQPCRLTHDAEDGLTNGLAEFIAQEELDRDRGFWWSPDSQRIAFQRADTRHIPVYPIVHQGLDRVDIEPHRYPFAGQANARVAVGLLDVAGGDPRWLDLGDNEDIYLARVDWRPDGRLVVQVLSRDQRGLDVYEYAGDERRLLFREQTDPWLNLHNDARFLESGELLWSSERTGFRHLYLYDADCREARALTSGDWVVTRVLGLDEPSRAVYFVATRESPLERHIYRVSLDGGEPERLTTTPGWHDGVLGPEARHLVIVSSSLAHGPRYVLRDLTTGSESTFFENDGATADALGLRPPEIVSLPAADGVTTLYGALYRPPAGSGPYPLIVSVYGGPHAQRVADEWSLTVDLRAQYLAQQGFLVFRLDNRGSANRGLAFEAPLHLRMGSVEVDDQVAGVRWLVARGEADPARVGVYGWSYGGYMTCLCLMRAPDVFRVGVAGAPVTHWDGYDTGYTERYMGTPATNPDGYRDSAVMAHLDGLSGKLLLVHGMIDENVHFRHTARLLVALAKAGKEYDLLIYPEERHMPRDARGLEDQERRVIGYFERHL
jgi:dipeptidyl-peptidase-4